MKDDYQIIINILQKALAEKSGRFVEIREDMQHSLSLLFSNMRTK